MFKVLAESRKKGLLKSNLNFSLILLGFFITVWSSVVLVSAVVGTDTPLNLRYSSTLGPYDRGDWTRALLLSVYLIIFNSSLVVLCGRLLKLKKPNFVTAVLVVATSHNVASLIVVLQIVAYSNI